MSGFRAHGGKKTICRRSPSGFSPPPPPPPPRKKTFADEGCHDVGPAGKKRFADEGRVSGFRAHGGTKPFADEGRQGLGPLFSGAPVGGSPGSGQKWPIPAEFKKNLYGRKDPLIFQILVPGSGKNHMPRVSGFRFRKKPHADEAH